jgi:hypothetical protein
VGSEDMRRIPFGPTPPGLVRMNLADQGGT